MNLDEILSYKVRTPWYSGLWLLVMAVNTLWLIVAYNPKDIWDGAFWLVVVVYIVGGYAFFREMVKVKKRRLFYNSIVVLGQEILRDKDHSSHNYIELLTSFIIEHRFKKYDRECWEKKELENMDAPFSMTSGENWILNIANAANNLNVKTAQQKYIEFTLEEVEKEREKAKKYFKDKQKNLHKRWKSAEQSAKWEGVKSYDIIDEQEKTYRIREKEKRDKEELQKENAENAAIQIITSRCRFCHKKIPRFATKCPHCTADL